MNEVVEAWFRGKNNGVIKVYRHSPGKMGLYINERSGKEYHKIFVKGEAAGDINIVEMMVHELQSDGFELLVMERQVKERVFGNADEAYVTTEFNDGKIVKQYAGPCSYDTPAQIRKEILGVKA